MQSPPTLPRRRGRLQPDPNCCGPAIAGLSAEGERQYGRPVICRAADATFSPPKAGEGYIFCALSKCLVASSDVDSTNAKNDGCGPLIAGIGFLRLPASTTSAQRES